MKRRGHSPGQISRLLAEDEKLLGQGQSIDEVSRQLDVTESTWHRWRNQYGGMRADDAERLQELEKENKRLKKIVADQARDRHVKGAEPGILLTPNGSSRAVSALEEPFGVSEYRACRAVDKPRSTQRLLAPAPSDNEIALMTFHARAFAGAGGGP